MEKYNYLRELKNDVREYIAENINTEEYTRDELAEKLQDDCWVCDSVTGNASGSYTFNTWQAEENICHNFDLITEACEEFGGDYKKMIENPEAADVTIRCYLLGQAIAEVLEEDTYKFLEE